MSDRPLIFIAYFGPDRPSAIGLHTALSDAGFRPWCDAVDLIPGDLWDEVIPGRLRAATLILVLFSNADHDGWYARAEIADGIAQVRKGKDRWVMPVLLDGAKSADLPYGLSRSAHVAVSNRDWTDVLHAVRRRFEAAGLPVPTGPGGSGPVGASTARIGRPGERRQPSVDVDRLVQATINRRLDRSLLLSWLPRDLAATLPLHRSYFEQITSDLTELAQMDRLDDGQRPLAVWLRQAERLAGPFAEARIYRDALRNLGR